MGPEDHPSDEQPRFGHADREPTAEEAARADEHDLDPDVAESYEDAIERGAAQEGEGRITP